MSGKQENPFWLWSLDRYSHKTVERTLLKLQDECGFDVNVALWCCWRAEIGAEIDESALNDAVEAKREWTANVIHPLRTARRYLKSIDTAGDDRISELRADVKAAELEAEQHVQNLLFQFDHSPSSEPPENPRKMALDHLSLYAKLLDAGKNPAFSKNLLQELVDNIFKQTQALPNNGSRREKDPAEEQ